MFALPLDQKSVTSNAPDETADIDAIIKAYNLADEYGRADRCVRAVNHRLMRRGCSYMPSVYLVVKNSSHCLPNRGGSAKKSVYPRYLMGAFVHADHIKAVPDHMIKDEFLTVSAVKKAFNHDPAVLEGGVVPIKPSQKDQINSPEGPAAYFATGRTLFHLMTEEQRSGFLNLNR